MVRYFSWMTAIIMFTIFSVIGLTSAFPELLEPIEKAKVVEAPKPPSLNLECGPLTKFHEVAKNLEMVVVMSEYKNGIFTMILANKIGQGYVALVNPRIRAACVVLAFDQMTPGVGVRLEMFIPPTKA